MSLSWSKSASAELIKMTQQLSSKSSDKFRAIKPINILFPRPYAKTTHLWILKSKHLLVQPLMFLNVCCFKPNCCWQKTNNHDYQCFKAKSIKVSQKSTCFPHVFLVIIQNPTPKLMVFPCVPMFSQIYPSKTAYLSPRFCPASSVSAAASCRIAGACCGGTLRSEKRRAKSSASRP